MAKVTHYSVGSKTTRRMRSFLVVCFLILIFLFFVTVYIRHVYTNNLKPVSSSQQSHLITIPSGSNLTKIASILKKGGVIRASLAFEWYVRNDNFAKDN